MIGALLLILNLCMLAANFATGWSLGVVISGVGVLLSIYIIANDE